LNNRIGIEQQTKLKTDIIRGVASQEAQFIVVEVYA